MAEKVFAALVANDEAALRGAVSEVTINQPNENGYPPLFYACMRRGVKAHMARQLIRFGADVNQCSSDGESPLYISSYNNRLEFVRMLVEYKVNVKAVNGSLKDTALHAAARFGYTDVTELLLQAGADINACNARKETALYVAAKAGKHEVVYQLLARQADPSIANEDGKNPLYIASEKGQKHVVLLLKASPQSLPAAKEAADAEWRSRPEKVPTTDELLSASVDDVRVKRASISAGESKVEAPPARMEVLEVVIPHPKITSQDPFTGKSKGPCRSLEEVGYRQPPPIPEELRNLPPPQRQRIGGTQMRVSIETASGGKSVEPYFVGSTPGDDTEFDGVKLPSGQQ